MLDPVSDRLWNPRKRKPDKINVRKKEEIFATKVDTKQCCGYGMFIRDPGSDFFPSRIPDPNFSTPDPHQRILSIITPKNGF
jgi:hypothetical protein